MSLTAKMLPSDWITKLLMAKEVEKPQEEGGIDGRRSIDGFHAWAIKRRVRRNGLSVINSGIYQSTKRLIASFNK